AVRQGLTYSSGVKRNGVDLDLDFGTEDLETEVERLQQLGAQRISQEQSEHGFCWIVVADPEGNEFCVFVPPTTAVPEA
ncbi:VOC family protein, partial [Streptomyces sp. NPDC005373]|uniref:VOC family protein n=1 Tax=Streptomyces sp. NPDC005373 TaxID=3156879 RepID=UPI0033B63C66